MRYILVSLFNASFRAKIVYMNGGSYVATMAFAWNWRKTCSSCAIVRVLASFSIYLYICCFLSLWRHRTMSLFLSVFTSTIAWIRIMKTLFSANVLVICYNHSQINSSINRITRFYPMLSSFCMDKTKWTSKQALEVEQKRREKKKWKQNEDKAFKISTYLLCVSDKQLMNPNPEWNDVAFLSRSPFPQSLPTNWMTQFCESKLYDEACSILFAFSM